MGAVIAEGPTGRKPYRIELCKLRVKGAVYAMKSHIRAERVTQAMLVRVLACQTTTGKSLVMAPACLTLRPVRATRLCSQTVLVFEGGGIPESLAGPL